MFGNILVSSRGCVGREGDNKPGEGVRIRTKSKIVCEAQCAFLPSREVAKAGIRVGEGTGRRDHSNKGNLENGTDHPNGEGKMHKISPMWNQFALAT